MKFDYIKAYCCLAVPAWEIFSPHLKNVHKALCGEVKDLKQGRDLNIPITNTIRVILEPIDSRSLAELSRASYFIGHWYPSLLPRLWDNSSGESWKVANVIDQILREKVLRGHTTPENGLKIHEGLLCTSGFEAFALATEQNLHTFEAWVPYAQTKDIAAVIGDVWPSPNVCDDNDLYTHFLSLKHAERATGIKKAFDKRLADLEQGRINAQKEIQFLLELNDRGVTTYDVIYYTHKGIFCFGWRNGVTVAERDEILDKISDMPERYNIEFKLL